MAGDTKAAGTRVEASGMSSIHLTAVQGVVLWGEGQWLSFQSVLGVNGSEGAMLVQMGGVAQHGRITGLNHRPGRAPWIRGRVESVLHVEGRWVDVSCLGGRIVGIIPVEILS